MTLINNNGLIISLLPFYPTLQVRGYPSDQGDGEQSKRADRQRRVRDLGAHKEDDDGRVAFADIGDDG